MIHLQKSHKEMTRNQPGLSRRLVPNMVKWLLNSLLLILLGYYAVHPAPLLAHRVAQTQEPALVTQEIRYHMPEAGEVFFVWGIDDGSIGPGGIRPEGNILKEGLRQKPMDREEDIFLAKVQVPSGTAIVYGFLITKDRNGVDIEAAWDGEEQGYQMTITEDGVVEVETTLSLTQAQVPASVVDVPLVTQEIRYHMPEASEVFLVWGIDGWQAVTEEARPAGTVIKNEVMHTPMDHEGDTFIAKVQVPAGTAIDYGFLITKTDKGVDIEPVWDGDQDQPIIAAEDGLTELETTVTLDQTPTSQADAPLVTQEIRYHMPEAGEVFLVWGINGWQVTPEEARPAGTVVQNDLMHTPMRHEGDTFITELQVPASTTIHYGFSITQKSDGLDIEAIWDGGPEYQTIASQDNLVEVEAAVTLDEARASLTNPLVTQEIRYHLPEAGEVFFVWGLNGWQVAPEAMRPAGTVVKNEVMHTPMEREADAFVAKLQIPAGVTVDYGFLITKNRRGTDIELVWDGDQDHLIATEEGQVEIQALPAVVEQIDTGGFDNVLLWLGLGLLAVIGLGFAVFVIRKRGLRPQENVNSA